MENLRSYTGGAAYVNDIVNRDFVDGEAVVSVIYDTVKPEVGGSKYKKGCFIQGSDGELYTAESWGKITSDVEASNFWISDGEHVVRPALNMSTNTYMFNSYGSLNSDKIIGDTEVSFFGENEAASHILPALAGGRLSFAGDYWNGKEIMEALVQAGWVSDDGNTECTHGDHTDGYDSQYCFPAFEYARGIRNKIEDENGGYEKGYIMGISEIKLMHEYWKDLLILVNVINAGLDEEDIKHGDGSNLLSADGWFWSSSLCDLNYAWYAYLAGGVGNNRLGYRDGVLPAF